MSSLANKTIAQAYGDYIHAGNDNNGIEQGSTPKALYDGKGNKLPLEVTKDKLIIQPTANGNIFEVKNKDAVVLFTIDTTNNTITASSGVKFVGDGSLLNNVPSSGTGGTTSTTNVSIQADSDANGSGDIIFYIGAKEVLRIPNSYAVSLPAGITGNYVLKTVAEGWGNPAGGYLFDGVDDYTTTPFTQKVSGVSFWIYPTTTNRAVLTFGTNMQITFNSSNVLQFGSVFANVTAWVNGIATTTLQLNKWNFVKATFSEITPTVFEIGRSGSSYFAGMIALVRAWNRTLTNLDNLTLYNNGRPDLAVLPFSDVGASNTALTSGTLVIGKRYRIDTYVAGDNFTNVASVESGTINTSGCIFRCISTTPTVWTNASSLRQIGCVAEYLPQNATGVWLETQNGLHGTTAGNPTMLYRGSNAVTSVFDLGVLGNGLMDVSIDGLANLEWQFGDGTISKTRRPAKTLSGKNRVAISGKWIESAVIFHANSSTASLSFNLNKIPHGLRSFTCSSANTITGDIANLPANMVSYDNRGSNTTSGDIANLPANMTYYYNGGSNTTSGNIVNLPANMVYYANYGANTTSGDIANLPANMVYYDNRGLNQVNAYTAGRVWANNMQLVRHEPAGGYGLTSTMVDNLLIDLANVATWTGSKIVWLAGNNAARTGASDAAVATLQGKGVTVTTN